ncbi:hypothetical protein ALC57_10377 [Trachymyrmex cornetzi]|uniref:THAP-type domain-containing protein n=1 Tax=Trachymyrmex cornetzi TaxID=471704 RepID=A0A151J495_9HYME|nr:hypothetical protein ALC57_10377 [Trachymyrmex cornetzi]
MPHCIAPGCTSGYKSNPEKIHFFTVPKDENMITLWQNAIRRKDFVIRAGQFLCEKHFLPEDILWKRELTSPDGQVLGVVSNKINILLFIYLNNAANAAYIIFVF